MKKRKKGLKRSSAKKEGNPSIASKNMVGGER